MARQILVSTPLLPPCSRPSFDLLYQLCGCQTAACQFRRSMEGAQSISRRFARKDAWAKGRAVGMLRIRLHDESVSPSPPPLRPAPSQAYKQTELGLNRLPINPRTGRDLRTRSCLPTGHSTRRPSHHVQDVPPRRCRPFGAGLARHLRRCPRQPDEPHADPGPAHPQRLGPRGKQLKPAGYPIPIPID